MKRIKIHVTIIKEDQGYSATAFSGDDFIATIGENFEELQANIIDALELAIKGTDKMILKEDLIYTLDLQSFFKFYKVINAKALSKRIGMNQSLLAQYISGKKKPSRPQAHRIFEGVQKLGKELSDIHFII
jgi:hypothetical protein